MTRLHRFRLPLMAVLVTVLFLAVAALATGKPGKPKPVKGAQAAAAQYQYGQPKVTVCHKGKTIRVAQPAARAHQRHGDTLGPCP
jgi:hypothetical protein